jgi:hypothetical protein
LPGSCFLFLTQEFQLTAVSLIHPSCSDIGTSIAGRAPQLSSPVLA